MTDATPIPPVGEAVERVSRYLAEHAKMRQLDKEQIHGLHVGDVREAILTPADLRTILSDHARLSAALGEAAAIIREQAIEAERMRGALAVVSQCRPAFPPKPTSQTYKAGFDMASIWAADVADRALAPATGGGE